MLLQRLLQPLHSSDPCAKALTLRSVAPKISSFLGLTPPCRTLGAMSVFLGDDVGLQHSIRNCLSSNHPLEASAAIIAVDGVCQRSASFARSILPYVKELVQGLLCTPATKLRLIYVLRHMGHDPSMIKEARELLEQVLTLLPSEVFARVTLHTLTLLSTSSLLFVANQSTLLLQYLSDARVRVRLLVLRDLRRITEVASHLVDLEEWPIDSLVSLCELTEIPAIRREILLLLSALFRVFGAKKVIQESLVYAKLQNSCEGFLKDRESKVSVPATETFALLAGTSETSHCLLAICLSLHRKLRKEPNRKGLENDLYQLSQVLAALVRENPPQQVELLSYLVNIIDVLPPSQAQLLIAKIIGSVVSLFSTPQQLHLSTSSLSRIPNVLLRSIGSIDALYPRIMVGTLSH